MTEPTLDTLTQRLDRLEREVRRWRRIGATVLIVPVLLAIMGAATEKVPETITAKKFVLVDKQGGPRAKFHVDDVQGTLLEMTSPSAKSSIVLSASDLGATIHAIGGEVNTSAALQAFDEASLTLQGKDGGAYVDLQGRNLSTKMRQWVREFSVAAAPPLWRAAPLASGPAPREAGGPQADRFWKGLASAW